MYLEVCSVHGSGGLGRACEGGRELPLAGLEALVLGVLTCRRPQGGSSALLPEHWWWGAERLGCPLGQECLGGMCLWVGNLGLAQSCSASFFFLEGRCTSLILTQTCHHLMNFLFCFGCLWHLELPGQGLVPSHSCSTAGFQDEKNLTVP